MAYNRNHAKTLCNKTEYQFFESSLRGNIDKLPRKSVQDGIKRARTLRDKYRDLHKRQRLATRDRTGTKKGVKPATNERTEQKAKLFAEVLERFEAQLKALKEAEKAVAANNKKTAAKKKAAKKKAAKTKIAKKKVAKKKVAKKKVAKKKVAKKVAKKKAAGKKAVAKADAPGGPFVSEKASAASERKRQQDTRAKAVMGHKRASTQRNQAKRDGGKKR